MSKWMQEFIVEQSGLTIDDLNEKAGHDWIMNAEYCLEHGVCDTIIEKLAEAI